jgi:hypothetical protein
MVVDMALTGHDSGWAVAECDTRIGTRRYIRGVVYRLTGGVWQPAYYYPQRGPACYKGMSAVGPEEMWVVGCNDYDNYVCDTGGLLVHYLNGDWEIIELDEDMFGVHRTGLRDIDMLDSTHGWMVGYGLIFRYADGQWSVDLDIPCGEYCKYHHLHIFQAISMADLDHGWAGGWGLLYRYHQGTWTRWQDHIFDETALVMDIESISPDEAWAVGYRETKPDAGAEPSIYQFESFIWHYYETSWHEIPSPEPEIPLWAIKMISPNEGWAVGGGPYQSQTVLLHYVNGEWRSVVAPESTSLSSVDATHQSLWLGGDGFYQPLSLDDWKQVELGTYTDTVP